MIRIVLPTDECVCSLTAMRQRAAGRRNDARARARAPRRAPRGWRPSRPCTNTPPAVAGSPARSLRNRSAWFSACTAPADSIHEMPEIDAHDTIMSKSNDAFVGAAGMNAKKRGLSHEITAGASTSA